MCARRRSRRVLPAPRRLSDRASVSFSQQQPTKLYTAFLAVALAALAAAGYTTMRIAHAHGRPSG